MGHAATKLPPRYTRRDDSEPRLVVCASRTRVNLSDPVTFDGADAENFLRELSEVPSLSVARLRKAIDFVMLTASPRSINELPFAG
jgi:hypothetical protein